METFSDEVLEGEDICCASGCVSNSIAGIKNADDTTEGDGHLQTKNSTRPSRTRGKEGGGADEEGAAAIKGVCIKRGSRTTAFSILANSGRIEARGFGPSRKGLHSSGLSILAINASSLALDGEKIQGFIFRDFLQDTRGASVGGNFGRGVHGVCLGLW